MISKMCETCGNGFSVIRSRATTAKYCSTSCRDIGLKALPNQICSECASPFHMKQSQINRYSRTLGVFCSNSCAAESKKKTYTGSKNPNYRGRVKDEDGYKLYIPQASFLHGLKRMKLHQAVCCEVLGITKIPKGLHIHHRDCDIENNNKENLAVLNQSDHRWLHKQFGNATLWAYCHNEIDLASLVKWSDNKERALLLLPLTVVNQTKTTLKEYQ